MHLTTRFPEGIAYGAVGGPAYVTDVVEFAGGKEQRNSVRAGGLSQWDVAKGLKNEAEKWELILHFRMAKGRAHSFGFRDPSDNLAAIADGVTARTAGGVYTMYRRYTNVDGTEDKRIRLPVQGTTTIYANAVARTAGAAPGNYALNYTTGTITFVAESTKAITAITQANPGKVTTSTAHGFTNGQVVTLTGIGGMTQLNGQEVTVTNVDADEFTIGVNTTGYTAYSSGGFAALYLQAGDVVAWSGQFDLKCRYGVDKLAMVNQNLRYFIAQTIPVIEVDED